MTGFPPDTQTHADTILEALAYLDRYCDARNAGAETRRAEAALDALLVELAAARTERDEANAKYEEVRDEKFLEGCDECEDRREAAEGARDDAIQALRGLTGATDALIYAANGLIGVDRQDEGRVRAYDSRVGEAVAAMNKARALARLTEKP